jgi:phosphoribosyl 1,2-cyclic phosphate phosphodiesterase
VLVSTPRGRILIDTPPELRLQLLRAQVPFVHALLYTHYHADHLLGFDDVRPFPKLLGGPLPVYCSDEVESALARVFPYAFNKRGPALGFVPQVEVRRIDSIPFDVLDESVMPIPFIHNVFNVLGFRFGTMAYCTDVGAIPESSWPLLEGLDTLILGALRYRPHPAHFSVQVALEVVVWVKPKRTYFTHMSHELDYDEFRSQLPPNVIPAYDGLTIEF